MSDNYNIAIYVLGNQVTQGFVGNGGGETMSDNENISIHVLGNQVTQGDRAKRLCK